MPRQVEMEETMLPAISLEGAARLAAVAEEALRSLLRPISSSQLETAEVVGLVVVDQPAGTLVAVAEVATMEAVEAAVAKVTTLHEVKADQVVSAEVPAV